jgi:hypothetical protein
MTEAEDELLRKFNYTDGKSKATMVHNYELLCRLLFGEDVTVPDPSKSKFASQPPTHGTLPILTNVIRVSLLHTRMDD